MLIGLISDSLTRYSFHALDGVDVKNIYTFLNKKIDMLFVESAWEGRWNYWKYKIASYPDFENRNNYKLRLIVQKAKDLGIPTVFWNKEDSIHFNRFIDSAKLFDHVFTVDENCIPLYKKVMGETASIHTLMFAVQPKFHKFLGFNFRYNRANFIGSYSHHIHDDRRKWQNQLFETALESELGLTIFDRNSKRKSSKYRYPQLPGIEINRAVNYPQTAKVYRDYLVSLNVNTITNSATMFSRRLVEALACGGIVITTPAKSVTSIFRDYCYVVDSRESMLELFSRLKRGPSKSDLERAYAGACFIAENHTWENRLNQIIKTINLKV